MLSKSLKKSLIIGVICLFLFSSVSQIAFGNDTQNIEIDDEINRDLANLRFLCTTPDGFDDAKYEYYKEEILDYYSKDKVEIDVETDKKTVQDELPSTVSFGPINSSWPMKCHDLHHTGRSSIGTVDIVYDEIWSYDFDKSMDTSPAIGSDGTIYVGGSYEKIREYLFAINPDGSYKWKYKTNGLIDLCCPAIAEDGTIYIGSWDDSLHAVNPDGTRKWKFNSGQSIYSSPAIADDGTIYFGTMAGAGTIGKIFALNPNGTEKWQYSTNYHIMSDPAIGDDGTIYIGSSDDYLYAMNPDGSLKWRYKTGDWIRGPPSIAEDGTIYIGSWDDYVYAIYPNGTLRWKTEIWYGSDTNPTLGTDGIIYISSSSRLFAIEPEYGDILWEFNLGGDSTKSSPAMCADGIIYVGIEIGTDDGGEIVAVNSDGTENWRQRLSNTRAESSPAIGSDGTIYICATSGNPGNTFGKLHAFGELDPDAPEAPSIYGETNGEAGVEYEYTFSTTDPNSDDVYYYIEWGDGSAEDWFGPYNSGEEVILSHTWDDQDTYTIRTRSKDTDNLWGPWGELEVSMPVNQQTYSFPLLQRLLERFPNAFQILKQLVGL